DYAGLLEKSLLCLNKAITETRKITRTLNTAAVDDLGLEAAIGQLPGIILEEKGKPETIVHFDKRVEEALAPAYKLTVYRIIQEQLQNIRLHAAATAIGINVHLHENRLLLSISDNGSGFDRLGTGKTKGMGFIIIRNRVAALDGLFELYTAPGQGCRLEIELPLRQTMSI
ncbi:MAG: hypothetical protein JST39_13205, partial [Bacteroidetes bacterium]|nr:hypothetical protein [Bacteroidota bacterium]